MNHQFEKQMATALLVLLTLFTAGSAWGQMGPVGEPAPRYQNYQETTPAQPYTQPQPTGPPAAYPTTPAQPTGSPTVYPTTPAQGFYPPAVPYSAPYSAPASAPYSAVQAIPAAPTYPTAVTPASHPVIAAPVTTTPEIPAPPVKTSVEDEVIAAGEESDSGDVEYWYEPGYWFPKKIWSGGAEIGLSGSEGNAQSFSMRAGLNAKRKTDRWLNAVDWVYNRANANGVATAHNSLLTINNDLKLGESPWTMFVNLLFEYDEFRAFDLRVAVNGGVGYQFIDTDNASLIGRIGSGGSQEIGAVDDDWVAEAVFGMEYKHQLSKRQKVSLKVDYFPEWSQYENYRMLTNASWEMLLHEASNMSLKISAIDRYDSTPAGARPNDIDYALLLLWKL